MKQVEQLTKAMQAKLAQAGIPAESIEVFGRARCNVHVRCLGRETAEKWAFVLGSMFQGAVVKTVASTWEAKQNHGTCLVPTVRKGFLVAAASLALAGCAAPVPPPLQDPYCVEHRQVPITVNGQVHLVEGECIAWMFGPSRTQREQFDRRSRP